MLSFLGRLYQRFILRHHPIPYDLWRTVSQNIAILRHLTPVERAHLRVLSTLFLYKKTITGTADLVMTDRMKLCIAIQSCLLVLHLGLHYLDGWVQIIVYPGQFRVQRDITDAAGVVHHEDKVLIGESWSQGPVIVSWQSIAQDMHAPFRGHNVIIHEIAHKLDMFNGAADGLPPLVSRQAVQAWIADLSQVYETLHHQLQQHHPSLINAYAGTSPSEFFAVVSEYFFSAPTILFHHFPTVYRHLQQFYQQNPIMAARKSTTLVSD